MFFVELMNGRKKMKFQISRYFEITSKMPKLKSFKL